MDGVSGAFAVVSLAIQLGGTINQIRKFLRNVQNASIELKKLLSLLDQLHSILEQAGCLVEQQTSALGSLGSVASIASAIESCDELVKSLGTLAQELQRSAANRKGFQRRLSSMKFLKNKEDIGQLETQLRDAIMTLQTAIMINFSQTQ